MNLALLRKRQFASHDVQRRQHPRPTQLIGVSGRALQRPAALESPRHQQRKSSLEPVAVDGAIGSEQGLERRQRCGVTASGSHGRRRQMDRGLLHADAIAQPRATPMAAAQLTVAITGASGALGRALLQRWHRRGARLIAITHGTAPLQLQAADGSPIPLQQLHWRTGQEDQLLEQLQEVDVLVLNHGINLQNQRSSAATSQSLEVNALSSWRLLEGFAQQAARLHDAGLRDHPRPEVWINTSEAEIEPAFSPLYEISKRLLGQLISLRSLDLSRLLRIRRLVLGPFRSNLNPVGLMPVDFVAAQVMLQAALGCNLIIVTPNPLIYVLMPLTTLGRWLYFKLLTRPEQDNLRNPGP